MQVRGKFRVLTFPCLWTQPAPADVCMGILGKKAYERFLAGEIGVPTECLDEVNEFRATKKLPAFKYDSALGAAALNIALKRAKAHLEGHTKNDFAGLPSSARAEAAGCAMWKPGTGWGSCCSDEIWTYAGAAYCINDDMRFMDLFVSNTPNRPIFREGT